MRSNFCVFDVETGGLDPEKNPITEFAAVILEYGTLKQVSEFSTYVKPYAGLEIEQVALDKTMVTASRMNKGMELEDFIPAMEEFLSEHIGSKKNLLIGVGHNVGFDVSFLNKAFKLAGKKYNMDKYFQTQYIDTLQLSHLTWTIKGDEKLFLQKVCEDAGVKLTDAHGAMNDVYATADLLRYFTKNLRGIEGRKKLSTAKPKRETGLKFFEFSCGAMEKH